MSYLSLTFLCEFRDLFIDGNMYKEASNGIFTDILYKLQTLYKWKDDVNNKMFLKISQLVFFHENPQTTESLRLSS